MSHLRIFFLASLAMVAFAGNSLLCRAALKDTGIDAASFTTVRLISGALILGLIVWLRNGKKVGEGSWLSAFALFVYAAAFSFAYISLPTATGALILFAAVQATMIGFGIASGERLVRTQVLGLVIAFTGLIGLLLPGLAAPPLTGSFLMLAAGVAWGIYSLRGKGAGDPIRVTSGNFLRAVPITAVMSLSMLGGFSMDAAGFGYAVASGVLASGLGYVVWYQVLPALQATSAASLQLTVPVIAGVSGILILGEPLSLRLILTSMAILGGVALVIRYKKDTPRSNPLS